ncbi:MAG: hypothetical protein IJ151_02775 [Bacteroidales bacterium]|nr:hypothetical protein [Bacteroidales bacterium]
MKVLFKSLLALTVGLAVMGCSKEYDDSEIKGDISNLKSQIQKIQDDIKSLNGQVSGLSETIDQWKKGGYVESIQPTEDETGFTITFVGGKTVTLYHGTNGKDGKDGKDGENGKDGKDGQTGATGQTGPQGQTGETPTIKLDTDGNYYWADSKGFILVDGNKVPATTTPSFNIDADGHLIMTIAGQEFDLGLVKGSVGDSLFKKIEPGTETVVFTLSDNTTFEIPIAKAFKLVIENTIQEVTAGQVVEIDYTVTNANATTTVDCFANGGYKAKVDGAKVIVTVPDPLTEGEVLVWAQNDKGLFSLVKLSFTAAAEIAIVTPEADYQAIAADATSFEINLTSNVDVDVVVPEEATWVSVIVTKAAYKLNLTLEANTSTEPREATIDIVRKDNGKSIQKVKIAQLGKPKTLTIERVWGKFSTAEASWNEYFGGAANADRNYTMDDEYIYIPEASTSYAKIWKIAINDPSKVTTIANPTNPTGYFKTSAARVMDPGSNMNGGKPVLIVSNMVMDEDGDLLKLYVYDKGTDNAPSEWMMDATNTGRRLGDVFTTHGTFANGGFLFKDWAKLWGNGTILVWRTAFNQVPTYNQTARNPTWNTIKDEGGRAAFYPYPGQTTPQKGIYTGTETAYFVSEEGSNVYTWNASTFNTTVAGGYYNNAGEFNFFEFNGKRYIAYVKHAASNDGRFYILEGETTDDWQDLLGSKRKVIYQGSLQQDIAFNDAAWHAELEEPSPKSSGNSGMGCSARVINGEVYIMAGKQNVGLSVFKMSLK